MSSPEHLFPGLMPRAARICYYMDLKNREDIIAAIHDGRLFPNHPCRKRKFFGYGWESHFAIHDWLGLPRPPKSPRPQVAPPKAWTQVGENLVRYKGGKIYLRAKVGGVVVRRSLKTGDMQTAKNKRDAILATLRQAESTGDAKSPQSPAYPPPSIKSSSPRLLGRPPKREEYRARKISIAIPLPLQVVLERIRDETGNSISSMARDALQEWIARR